jgi:hypothetical protein
MRHHVPVIPEATKDSRAMERPLACRKCHWPCVRPAKRRTGLDLFMALFFMRPFRCRSCRRRYYRLSF